MNARERFNATMHYQERDRCPIMDFGFWDETLVNWRKQGLPEGVKTDDFFGMDPQWIFAPIDVGLHPGFKEEVLEDKEETEVVRNPDGVTVERSKSVVTIPRHIDHTLKDRASWEKEYKWRYDGKNPDRYPKDWAERAQKFKTGARDYPLGAYGGSLFGRIRDLMGLEALSYLIYDDRALFEEMVETLANCVIDTLTPALEAGVQFDYVQMWEDMCYRAGPLLSPKIFSEVLVPHYKRITSLLGQYGIDIVVMDCDGDISQLVGLWLEAGVNTLFPFEIGTWQADPCEYRRRFGPGLRIMGGFNKRILASSTDEIKREIERLAPLVEEGGFIPFCDHRVPADVGFANYLFYIGEARRVWGKGLANLRLAGSST